MGIDSNLEERDKHKKDWTKTADSGFSGQQPVWTDFSQQT